MPNDDFNDTKNDLSQDEINALKEELERKNERDDALLEYLKKQDAERSEAQSKPKKTTNFVKKAGKKTANFADNATTGMDGSAFSLIRWCISFIVEIFTAVREFIEDRANGNSSNNKRENDEESDR